MFLTVWALGFYCNPQPKLNGTEACACQNIGPLLKIVFVSSNISFIRARTSPPSDACSQVDTTHPLIPCSKGKVASTVTKFTKLCPSRVNKILDLIISTINKPHYKIPGALQNMPVPATTMCTTSWAMLSAEWCSTERFSAYYIQTQLIFLSVPGKICTEGWKFNTLAAFPTWF